MMMRVLVSLSLVSFLLVASAAAFAPQTQRTARTPSTVALFAKTNSKPTFDKKAQRWNKASDDDGAYPYSPVGSLLRHGPSPFIARLTNEDEYEQGILKYMASSTNGVVVSRSEATGNMDAKLNNAMDWAYQKMEEKKGAPKVDYTVLKTKDAVLVLVWAFGVVPLGISVILETVSQF